MTVQPTRDQLREAALREDAKEHQPDSHGPGRCGDPECFTTCVVDGCDWPCETAWLLDQLDRAEHRIARLEAQTGIRGRAVVMYRERAREAEAERDAARGYISELETAVQSRNDVIKHRDTRIKAVRDVHTGTVWPGVADKPICDACDQMWPCATIRALEG